MDLAGKKFGRITVVSLSHIDKNSHWNCMCDCGTEFTAIGNNLTRGKSKSCGCLRRQATGDRSRTHGDSYTRLFRVWAGMRRRVLNKNDQRYSDYGGRGIAICERWNSYENFKKDMCQSFLAHCYVHGNRNTTIDRIDNDGDYSPKNCKWATHAEQNLNKRDNVLLRLNGEDYTIAELSRKFNINKSTMKDRLRRNWSLERAVNTPVKIGEAK